MNRIEQCFWIEDAEDDELYHQMLEEEYQAFLDHRAHVAHLHNRFRLGIPVVDVCPF